MKRKTFSLEMLEPRRLLSTTIYVSTGGNDSTATGAADAPFATIQAAVKNLAAGDIIDVMAGTYAGFYVGWNSVQSGTAAAPIIFQADPGGPPGSVIIDSRCNKTPDAIDVEANCNYLTFQGFTFANDGSVTGAGIRIVSCSNINILNNDINGMGEWGIYTAFSVNTNIEGNTCSNTVNQHGIYVANSPLNVQIIGNTCFDNGECGIQINGDASQGGTGIGKNCLVEDNVLYGNDVHDGAAMNFDGLQDSIIENNLLFNNHTTGIALFQEDGATASIGNTVANNTIVMAADATAAIRILDGSTNNAIFNNILLAGVQLDSASEPGLQMDYNIVSASVGYQNAHSIIATPDLLFAGATINNYELAALSPAIGLGVASLGGKSAPAVDMIGTARGPEFDVGCFQFQVPIAPPQPTSSQLAIAQVPTTATLGTDLTSIIVDVEDSLGQIVTTDNSNITLSIAGGPAGGTLGGALTVTAVNGVATFSGITVSAAGTYDIEATDGTLTAATSGDIVASLPPVTTPATLTFVQVPATATVDADLSPVIVDVLDPYGRLVTTDNSTVTLSLASSPSGSVLGGALSVVAVNGVATFGDLTVNAAGDYTIVASDGSLTEDTSADIAASLPPVTTPASLTIVQSPTSGTADSVLSPIIVDVEDPFGRLVATDSSMVTLSIASGSAGATLGGTVSVAAVNGVATFSDITVSTAGAFSLQASDGSLTGATTGSFTAAAAPVVPQLTWTQPPVEVTAGQKMSTPISINLKDQSGNLLVANHSFVKLTVASGPSGAKVYRPWARVVNGVATFTSTWFAKAGDYTLTATARNYTAISSSSFVVDPAAPARMIFSQQPISTTTGTDFDINVALLDRYGNLVTNDSTSSVTLELGMHPAAGVLNGTLSGTVAGGVAAFDNLWLESLGMYSLKAISADGLRAVGSKAFRIS